MAAVVSLSCTYFTILKSKNKSRPVLPWPNYTLTPTSSVLSPHSASWRRKQRTRFEWGPLSLPFYFRCNNFQIDSGKNGLQRAGRRATTSGRRSLCLPAPCFRPLSSQLGLATEPLCTAREGACFGVCPALRRASLDSSGFWQQFWSQTSSRGCIISLPCFPFPWAYLLLNHVRAIQWLAH